MARKKIYKSTLISLYYSFAYPYSIYCSHVWGQNYPSCLEIISLIQKKLVRIITCSPFRAHTEPLYFANKILNVSDINDYIIGIFMYECLYGNIPDIFRNFFSEMLMSIIIIFGMQMIYMYHTDDLILENSVSKLQEQIYEIIFHRLLKNHNQLTYLGKYEALLDWEKNIHLEVWLTLFPPLRHVRVSERNQHPLWQWLVAYWVPSHCLNNAGFLSIGPSDFGSRYENCHCRKWI